MGGAEGKPAPGPQPAPAPQPAPGPQLALGPLWSGFRPAPGPWWSGFGPALHRRSMRSRFKKQECSVSWDQYVGWITFCFEPFGVWNVNYNNYPTPL